MNALRRLWRRYLNADNRYICGCCDDRFATREDGIAHVRRCHPEYAAALR